MDEKKPANRTKNRGQGPKDLNQIAFLVTQHAIGEIAPKPGPKPSSAMTLGSMGGLKDGKARSEALTPERRKEIAAKAALKRWVAELVFRSFSFDLPHILLKIGHVRSDLSTVLCILVVLSPGKFLCQFR